MGVLFWVYVRALISGNFEFRTQQPSWGSKEAISQMQVTRETHEVLLITGL